MEYMTKEKVFFKAGDKVMIKHDIANRPEMIVQSVDKTTFGNDKSGLLGVTCIWFSDTKELQKARFNTKDLKKL